jgi:hypothetical protein
LISSSFLASLIHMRRSNTQKSFELVVQAALLLQLDQALCYVFELENLSTSLAAGVIAVAHVDRTAFELLLAHDYAGTLVSEASSKSKY